MAVRRPTPTRIDGKNYILDVDGNAVCWICYRQLKPKDKVYCRRCSGRLEKGKSPLTRREYRESVIRLAALPE